MNSKSIESPVLLTEKKQVTIANDISRTGTGLFTGIKASITFHPAPENHGIVFRRIDLPSAPLIRAHVDYVHSTPRCTILNSEGASLQTVEHVLAAIYATGIDNILIDISGPEVPIFDGSSQIFVEMIDEAGMYHNEGYLTVHSIEKPLFFSDGDVHMVALPSDHLRISYTLHYPNSSLIGSQFISLEINAESFSKDLASSRTFSLYEEIMPYIEKGLLKGGSLENAVLIKEDRVINPDGLRFCNEMVRHKVLDMIGDLSLTGVRFNAHIIALRSGHRANSELAKILLNHIKMESF